MSSGKLSLHISMFCPSLCSQYAYIRLSLTPVLEKNPLHPTAVPRLSRWPFSEIRIVVKVPLDGVACGKSGVEVTWFLAGSLRS